MKALVSRFLCDEGGPTATEYAVMLALIIVICIAAIGVLGRTVNGVFTNVNARLTST